MNISPFFYYWPNKNNKIKLTFIYYRNKKNNSFIN